MPRSSVRRVVAGVMAVAGSVSLVAACRSSSASTPFCRALRQGDVGFNGDYDAVVMAMDRAISAVPAADRGDLRLVRNFVDVAAHPERHQGGITDELYAYAGAIPRLDARLRRECGVRLGKAGFPFFDPSLGGPVASTTSTTSQDLVTRGQP